MEKKNLISETPGKKKTKHSQLWLLLWKNLRLQRRSLLSTLVELCLPAIFVIILLPIRTIVNSEQRANFTSYKSFGLNMFDLPFLFKNFSFGYYPNNSELIDNITKKVGIKLHMTPTSFGCEEDMVTFVSERSDKYLFGVAFLNESVSNFTYELRFPYKPRAKAQNKYVDAATDWKTNLLFTIFPVLGPRDRTENTGGEPGYFQEGFLQVQKAIDYALIDEFDHTVNYIDLRLVRFPYPPYSDDKFVVVIIAVLPFIIMLSFVFTVILTAKAIVNEKETGMKEAMIIMGMKPWIYWLSWYIKTFLMLLPSLIFMSVSYKMKLTLSNNGSAAIVDKMNPLLFSIFLFLHASSLITFTFLCTTFFKKANNAATGAGMIYFFSYLPYLFISLRYESISLATKIGSCFISNLAMCLGVQLIGIFEGQGIALDFNNFTQGSSIEDKFALLHVMIVMLINNVIHVFLAYYFNSVLQGEHGVAKPWYFLVCPSSVYDSANHVATDGEVDTDAIVEDESIYANKSIGIRIQHLSKMFKQLGVYKKAVHNLCLNIYQEHITVLLGHNGAGKSTTISMITGLIAPTGGEIKINQNVDCTEYTTTSTPTLGYCPQHNLLFDNLTVFEHMTFFSKLKNNFSIAEIYEILELIELKDKQNALARTLSGGMKRKLSVAIAFIGGSNIVILDEPSSGMDPQARHCTWTLLQKFKKEKKCTILLTTHFMDEADFLGDRVAIMSQGKLRCVGSPLFLKSKYGSGYNLTITRKQKEEDETLFKYPNSFTNLNESNEVQIKINPKNLALENCEKALVKKICTLVKNKVPRSRLKSSLSNEISFQLPSDESYRFPDLFDLLDRYKKDLNILNIGISVTTVEEVFLKVEHDENKSEGVQSPTVDKPPDGQNQLEEDVKSKTEKELYYGLWTGSSPDDLNSGLWLLAQQFKALFIKRFIHSIRNKSLILSQIVLPILILFINLIYLKYGPIIHVDSPALKVNISSYGKNFVPYHVEETSHPLALNRLSSIYANHLSKFPNVQVFNLNNCSTVAVCPKDHGSIDDYLVSVGKQGFSKLNDEHFIGTEFVMRAPITLNLPETLKSLKESPKLKMYQKMIKIGKRAGSPMSFITSPRKRLTLISHFNNQPYHVPPLAVNLLTTTLLKYFTRSTSNSITIINHPLPRNLTDITNEIKNKDLTSFNIASGLAFGFSFLIASFSIILIKERESGSKHLQFMNGCSSIIFWLSAFIWDLINYLIPVGFVFLLLKAFSINEFLDDSRWIITFVILLCYGLAHIPQAYLFSYLFKISANGFAIITAWNILSSQATLLPVRILSMPMLKLTDVSVTLQTVFMVLFPNFAMGQSLVEMYGNHQAIETCKNLTYICKFAKNPCCRYVNAHMKNPCGNTDCLYWNENYWTWEKPGLLKLIICMILQFLVQFIFLLALEVGLFKRVKYYLKNNAMDIKRQLSAERLFGDEPKDDDVVAEETRIEQMCTRTDDDDRIFVVNKLTKHYKNFVAVKGISFAVRKTECFGLLGVNGAGKTSTFKMITGDEFITSGNTFLKDTSIKQDFKKFQRQLGYCPQSDPLIAQMTVLETMFMFARLRGIKSNLIQKTCLSLIKLLDLLDHVGKMCYTLSGGNKRKLSVAISLVGSPVIILLDEPTSGMDPKARRILWDCLNKIKNKGKSLILTTHSMDETEALCTKIGIMVNGELKCYGSLQHLKSKYGEGYTLMAKIASSPDQQISEDRIKRFISFILVSFKNSELKENRDGFVNMHIRNSENIALSTIFAVIENNKLKYYIQYYVVTQTKLEQIFLNFAAMQVDVANRQLGRGGCLSSLCF